MLPHHADTLRAVTEHFAREPAVLALVLGGSLAHGFAGPESDVDVMMVVSDDEHGRRLGAGQATFFSRELCTYAAGYVDGKYISEGFLRAVAAKGSEPARFAFQDARILFSRSAALPSLLLEAARYPREQKAERLRRFQAQFEAWRWYTTEAHKRNDTVLLRTAVAKLSLLAGRIVLAENELLYPYHKWFLRVLEAAPLQPSGLVPLLRALAVQPDPEAIEHLATTLRAFGSWSIEPNTWSTQFMLDSELNWLTAPAPVDDI